MRIGQNDLPKSSPVRELASRVMQGIQRNDCNGYAAQMAFYFLFALFPFLLFLTTLLAYLPIPDLLRMLLRILGRFIPGQVLSLVEDNLRALVSVQQGGLLSIGVLLSLWTASNAVTALMAALNDAFEVEEQRTWLKVRLISLLLVIGQSFFVILSLLLLMFGPRIGVWIASRGALGHVFTLAWSILRWPVIFCLMVTALAALYRFAPTVRLKWRETVPGAVTATAAWMAVSLLFSFYVNNFGSYDRTYGSIGAVIALLVWMYASGFVILLGGEINPRLAELHHEMQLKTRTERGSQMRKVIVSQESRGTVSSEKDWLDLLTIAQAELTSEDASHPIESALNPFGGAGWRAAEPGQQTIRLLFDNPLRIRHVHLVFNEDEQQRTQEFVLRWSSDNGLTYREIVRQQYNFSPPGKTREVEDYAVDLNGVTALDLIIIPDISGGEVRATLARLRIA